MRIVAKIVEKKSSIGLQPKINGFHEYTLVVIVIVLVVVIVICIYVFVSFVISVILS